MEELTVKELDVTAPTLFAASQYLGKYCEKPSLEFMLCKNENRRDPRPCLEYGKTLTACSIDFFRDVKKTCLGEFDQYTECIDRSSADYKLSKCRKTQAVLDSCFMDKLALRRPQDPGYYSRAKVMDTDRPKARGYVTPDFPDSAQNVELPPAAEIPRARFDTYPL